MESNLNGLMQKSRDLARLNQELFVKLKENERVVGEVNKEIDSFRKKQDKARYTQTELLVLEQKATESEKQKHILYRNIDVLKEDLLLKTQYLNNLKKKIIEINREKTKKKEEDRENRIKKLEINLNILKIDLIEKSKHLNLLKKTILKLKEGQNKTSREKESKLTSELNFLEKENKELRLKILDIIEREKQAKKNIIKETELFVVVSKKLKEQTAISERLKHSSFRLLNIEEKAGETYKKLGKTAKKLKEAEEKEEILKEGITKKDILLSKSFKVIDKLKQGIVYAAKEKYGAEKKNSTLIKKIEGLEKELKLSKEKIEEEVKKHKEDVSKFVEQYKKSRQIFESRTTELNEKIKKQDQDNRFLQEKIEFIKKVIAESAKKEIETRSELEILKKRKSV